MISIKGLHKFFNNGKQNEIHVINDVTLDLPERGITAIFGKSGCGKTTLLNVIGGLDGFADGTLTIEGRDIRRSTDEIRNKYVGYIFQNYNLNKNESCFDNVAAALRLCGMRDEGEIERRVDAALKNVGMEKYARCTPDTLSGGQQQRIAIARAIVKNPRIILADEPTGNLDEANTVMIMDLLREISHDHLVLLVTHEESLVDAYCDSIIELSDGTIVSVREGRADGTLTAHNKQNIYLGELERTEVSTPEISLEYYGERTAEPIELRIVNKDGRLYLELGTERVHIIDGTGEVQLVEGVYREQSNEDRSSDFDMTSLPEISGEKFGSLFTFKSSLKAGFEQGFKSKGKGRRALRRLLLLFAAVTVLMSAVFGSAIGDLLTASDSYNHNVFYVYTEDGEVSDVLVNAVGSEDSAIDFITLYGYYPDGDDNASFRMASFETFGQYTYNSNINTNAVFLSESLAKDLPVLAGSGEYPSDEYILISDKVADALLEKALLGYMDDYSDLIGITCSSFIVNGKSLRVGGVVRSGESAIYLSEHAMAKYSRRTLDESRAESASDFGVNVKEGETVIVLPILSVATDCPEVGEKISAQGLELTVSDVMVWCGSYTEWLQHSDVEMPTIEEYFSALLPEDADDGQLEALINERYFEYEAYKYSHLEEYMLESYLIRPDNNVDLWLYFEKGVTEIKSIYYSTELYKAESFKKLHGRYPTKAEYNEQANDLPTSSEIELIGYYGLYENEFYNQMFNTIYDTTCLVSDSDYMKLSKQIGETSEIVSRGGNYLSYTVVHSTDPERTESWLNERLGHLTHEYYDTLLTPSDVFGILVSYQIETIIGCVAALVVILTLMSVCMYFIMRSSLMSRIKEVGVYRAIGVSRRNLLFRFTVESALFTALTVLVGYLLTSAFVVACGAISPRVGDIFFYPAWYALIVLAVICGLSVICGILPVLLLLRKTPSEILAKYDI